MKKITFLIVTLVVLSIPNLEAANRYWIANSASNFNNTANWSTSSGGAGGASVPTTGDLVFFNGSGSGNCTFDIAVAFDGLRTGGYTGQIDLAGFSFDPAVSNTATCRFEGGTIVDGSGTSQVTFNTTGLVLFAGTTFNTPITGVGGTVRFSGGTFNNPVDVEDNGASSTNGAGGCTFNSTLKVTNSGTSYFLMGHSNPDIFNGDVTLLNTSTSRIRIAYNSAGNQFNGNLSIGSTNGSGVWFGENGGTSSLASTKTISVNALGFTTGDLRFKGFTQSGTTAQSFTLTSAARVYFQNGSSFNANITASAPRVFLNGCTFGGTSSFTKTGASDDNCTGGNTFTGNLTVTNNGTGSLRLGYSSADTYSANVTMNNTSTSSMYLAYGGAGNTIAGNLLLNNSGTGTNSTIILANSSSSSLTVNGTTTVNNNNSASNRNRIYLGSQGDIIFNDDLTIINNAGTNDSEVYCNDNVNSNNTYNGNIILSTTHSSSEGIRFGQHSGVGTLASGKTVSIGAGGFNGGRLHFRNFTQLGTASVNITVTDSADIYIYDSNWGGNTSFSSPRIHTQGTIYNGTCTLHKTGFSNNYSVGGNIFSSSTEIKNSGTGNFILANASADLFSGNLVINNIGTSNIYVAHNSPGNMIMGSLTANNNGSGTNSHIYVAAGSSSTLGVVGNVILSNTSSATNGHIFLGDQGDINLSANLTATNNPTGNAGYITIANNTSSTVTVVGNTVLNNSGAGTTKRIYLANNGDMTLNGTVTITNTASATNSEIYANNGANSTNQYNNNIILTSTSALSDGIRFGENNGTGTLAAGKTVTIGGGGFIAGTLRFKNFTQVGTTAHAITLTGTGFLVNQDSDWGGNVDFRAPRQYTSGTTYNGTAFLEKTGSSSDGSPGGNTFIGNTEIKNSGSSYFMFGNGNSDTFGGNLTLTNTGTNHIYVGYNGAGNTVAGNLTLNNTGSGTTANMYLSSNVASTLTVSGNTVINNTSTATNSSIYIGDNGDINFNGTLNLNNSSTGTNGHIYLGQNSNSQIVISGITTVLNSGSGTTKRTFLGNSGDVIFNGVLNITNSSSASNSEIFCNHSSASLNTYNQNITIASTNASADGIRFGQYSGSATLANGKTITVSGGGFSAGQLRLRNFQQLGGTAQNLTLTGTSLMYIENSNWGGNIVFKSPRFNTTGTTYQGTSDIEKTGGVADDACAGGNTFVGNSTITNSGSKYLMLGNGTADDFQANATITNSGSSHLYFARSGAGHTVGGNLLITNGASGTSSYYVLVSDQSSATLNVTGNVTSNTDGTGNSLYTYIGQRGDISIGGNLSITNSGSGATSNTYIANYSSSSISVSGPTTVLNGNTASTNSYVYLGNNGDITFNNTLDITNNSSATYSSVYANHDDNSANVYNGNITVSSTNVSCDGIRFGESNGSGTLASGKTITIPGVDPLNFIGGQLRFRNFTQLGNTPQSLELGPTATYIYNRGSSWGGNVTFKSPRVYTRQTSFSGTAYIEKTGASSDYSYGGNTFTGNAELILNNNTASGSWSISNDSLSNFGSNLTLKNIGSYSDLVFGSRQGTYSIGGNVTIEHNPSGTNSQYIYFSNNNAAIINIAGTTTIKNTATSTGNTQNLNFGNRGTINITGATTVENTGVAGSYKSIYLGSRADINFGGGLTLTNNSTASTANIIMANNSSSAIVVTGNTTATNSGAGASKRIYFGDYGDITFNGDLNMVNNASATYSEIRLNNRSNSVNTYNGNITLTSNNTTCDGYFFGYDGGAGTLATTKTISIPGVDVTNFIGGQLYFRNFTQVGATPQSFELGSTATFIVNRNSNWGGNVNFIAPRIYTNSSTYNGTATLHKSGGIGDDNCPGGNTFVGNTTLINSGSRYLLMGNGSADVFQANLDIVNSGSNNLYLGYNSIGNSVAGNFTSTNSAAGTGNYRVYISERSGSTLTIGGNATISQNGTGATTSTYFGNSGDVTVTGNLTATNSGSGTNSLLYFASNGNSAVQVGGTSSFTNNHTASATNRIYLGSSGDITFGNDVAIVNNSGANQSEIYSNYNSGSVATYNGNISVATYNINSDGILFGANGGSSTLATGKTISIPGVDAANFTGGQLHLRDFTQVGATAQSLELGPNATYIYIRNSSFDGNLDFSSPRVYTRNSTFNGNATFTKTGGVSDDSYGSNTFNGNASYVHQGTGRFRIANNSGNDYNGDLNITKSSTGAIHPVYNTTNTLAGDFTLNANSTVRIGSGGSGRIVFDGSSAQSINTIAATPIPEFRDIETNNLTNDITLNTPLYILTELDLNNGNLITTSTNVVYMNDNSTVSSVSNNAFVDGPLVKIGNDVFTFPVGDNGHYAPISMNRPTSGSAQFEAEYFNTSPHSAGFDTTTTSAGLDKISETEYWVLNRLAGSNNVRATIDWNSARSGDMGAGTLCDMRVARWDGSKWVNEGNGGTTGNASSGSVITGSSEDCSTSTNITSWVNDYPITLGIDSNFITWDGSAYDGGSGAAGAPNLADAGRILKVFAPGAVANTDASLDKIIVTAAGELTIASGVAVTVSGIMDNNGQVTIENNGSLIQTAAGGDENTGTGNYTVERIGNTSNMSYNIWSSPIKNADLVSVFMGANPCDMWVFDGTNQAWTHDFTVGYAASCNGNAVTFGASDVIAGGDGIMDQAKGYFVPGGVISTKDFDGDVNNGDITVAINQTTLGNQPFWNDDDWNLLGNPYPSALDASAFWTENAINNSRITDALYFWDDNGTGTGYNQNQDYASWNALGGVNSGNSAVIPNGSIASGQGFWVVANENTNVVINNSMRSGTNDQFFKTDAEADKHLAWVSATTPSGYNNNILVGYTSTTTDTLDAIYDAHKLAGNPHVRFASVIGTDEFSIQGFSALSIGENKVIPLAFFTDESGAHTFEEYRRQNLPANIKVYIRDLQTGVTHDFATGPYTVTLAANQTYTGRFELVFEYTIEMANGGSSSKDSPSDSTGTTTGVITYDADNMYSLVLNGQEYTLANEKGINGDVHVMDVNGKVVWSTFNTTSTSLNIDVNSLSAGIYFVQVINGNERLYHHEIIKR